MTTYNSNGLDRLLAPKSIAMVGASNNIHSIGGLVFANIKRSFKGELVPIHPKDAQVQGLAAYADISSLPQSVDLVVIAVASHAVEAVIEQAVAKLQAQQAEIAAL